MSNLLKISSFATILFLISSCQTAKVGLSIRPSNWATKVELQGLNNMYKVDNDLYRSEQPKAKAMFLLDSMKIKTILNVRRIRNDRHEAKNTKLVLKHVPINTWFINYDDVVASLKEIVKSEKPILIHCKHGSDRTGCIVAAYRMVKCGWTKEESIKEFKDGGFGYHAGWYPNILRLLNKIDIEQLKKDIKD